MVVYNVQGLVQLYEARTERFFTGSKWIMFAAGAVAAFVLYTEGLSTFFFVQLAGMAFYWLASRTPLYQIESRMDTFGSMGLGIVGGLLAGLFVGSGTRYYTEDSMGFRSRDYESEGQAAMLQMMLMAFAVLIVGALIIAFADLNAVMNYYSSYQKPEDLNNWYDENIQARELA